MKKLLILAAAIFACVTSRGQESLSNASEIISPVINLDNTVTFSLKAPDAGSVIVTGDFMPGEGRMEMDGNGTWRFTSPSLEPELYYYNFTIDGVKTTDPGNVYQIRDVASVMNYFIIKGQPGSKGWYYSANDVPRGNVSRVWYDSPSLGASRRMSVYTPPGYETGSRSYPVFYLLHGAGGDEEAWLSLGRASQIMDNLIAEGRAEPMIVVMTNGNPSRRAAPGETEEGLYKPTFAGSGAPGRTTMEGSFPDVVSYIDGNYKTLKGKVHRAIAGLSMGGGHSYRISMTYPDMFGYVGLFSAASQITPRPDASPEQVRRIEEMKAMLERQFAEPPRLYYIACGDTDFLYNAFDDLTSYFTDKGYPHVKIESDGGHIWRNWRIYLTDFASLLFK